MPTAPLTRKEAMDTLAAIQAQMAQGLSFKDAKEKAAEQIINRMREPISIAALETRILRAKSKYGVWLCWKTGNLKWKDGAAEQMARQGYMPEADLKHEVPHGLTIKGTSILYDADGRVEQYWNKTKPEGCNPDEVVRFPDPKKIVKTATLYDQAGKVTQQWVSEKSDDQHREELWKAFADGLKSDLPRYSAIEDPGETNSNLLAFYPIGDHHFGMLAWPEETGSDAYDLAIAEQRLCASMDQLVDRSPAAVEAVIASVGDLLHYDSFKAVTPNHGNLLDADSRFPKMIRVVVRALRYLIKRALEKHHLLTVILEQGNHDASTNIVIAELLAMVFENEPRVTVDTSPRPFHCKVWGKVMLGTHHGDVVKLQQLPLLFATDWPQEWGSTIYRVIHTGHVHHDQVKELAGATTESHRTLAPGDSHSSRGPWRSMQTMKVIIYHREFGEVARFTCNPRMLESV